MIEGRTRASGVKEEKDMKAEEQSQQWHQESKPIFARIATWREEHPHATMAEIEQAVDEQMQELRAQVLQEAAASPANESARCPDCEVPMQARGQRERRLQTTGGQWVTVRRTYLSCPRCGYGFFPPG
jgi:uncharacterized protein with PIN domain